ncbi:hypothetical protein CSPX01_13114 [Colletotrichum filicis]|nr:hypothetical protein CSPX01_13114 [Colletotrichum filicis]
MSIARCLLNVISGSSPTLLLSNLSMGLGPWGAYVKWRYTAVSAAIRSLCVPGTLEIVEVEEAHREENPAELGLPRSRLRPDNWLVRECMWCGWTRGADLGRPRFPSSLKSPDVVQPTEPTTTAGTKSDLDASTLAYLLHWQRYRMMACDSASYPMRQIHATSSLLFERRNPVEPVFAQEKWRRGSKGIRPAGSALRFVSITDSWNGEFSLLQSTGEGYYLEYVCSAPTRWVSRTHTRLVQASNR